MSRLVLCVLLFAASAVMGRPFESGYSNDNGVIRVSVFIDLSKEKKIKFPEGTAMLRANRLLHKACPELPAKYSVTGRVLTNSHNRVEKTYSYVVEYDPQSIDAVVKQAAIDAEKAREAARLAAEKAAAEKAAAEKAAAEKAAAEKLAAEKAAAEKAAAEKLAAEKAAEQQSLQEVDTAGKTGDKSPNYDAAKTNGTAAVQEPATNDIVRTAGVCASENNATIETNATVTNVTGKASGHEVSAQVANAPTIKACTTNSSKAATASVPLKDLTVKDIKDKMVKPKVTEKNGFRQIDVDSFGGIDPMDE